MRTEFPWSWVSQRNSMTAIAFLPIDDQSDGLDGIEIDAQRISFNPYRCGRFAAGRRIKELPSLLPSKCRPRILVNLARIH